MRKFFTGLVLLTLVFHLSGCVALLAGAGGTALWQAGKVISEESTTMERAIAATIKTFKTKKIILTENVQKNAATQIRGKDQGDKKVAVDIIHKGPRSMRIEIRVGLGDEAAARDILKGIKRHL